MKQTMTGKQRIRIKRSLIAIFMSAIMCCFVMQPMAVSAEMQKEVVRIGFYPTSSFQEYDGNGRYSGFGYDYYMQVQKYTRWEYEFVVASYSECIQMLLAGEIDIMSGIARTSEREEQMLFTETSISTSQSEIYARADSDIFYEDYTAFDGCKIAVLKGGVHTELEAYCEEHGFQVEMREYDLARDMETALANGEVDLLYATNISENADTKIVARFKKVPLYFAINKDKTQLAEELEEGLQKVADNNPDFHTQLSEKYMLDGANATATFTKQELEYIESGEPVYVIMNQHWAPISWYDENTGEFDGIVMDVIERVKQYSGLDFIYCSEEEYEAIEAEDPTAIHHVIAVLADDNTWAVNQDVFMTNHIVDSAVVMVTKRGGNQASDSSQITVALPKDFYITWCLQENLSEEQIVYYDTVGECLDAINKGDADVTYINELVATYFLSMLEYSNLFATSNSGYNEDLAFAVYRDSEAPLLSIMDKSLLCIGSDDMDEIIIQNSIAEQQFTIKGLYYSEPALVIGTITAIIAIALAILFGTLSLHARRRRLKMELESEQRTSTARTEFFMMISHEIRTPLNAIVGYLNFAEEECKQKDIDLEFIRRSQNAAKQLTYIAEDMLDYTKIASNEAKLKEDIFDMKEVIRTVGSNVELAAKEKELSFEFTIDDVDHEFIVGDGRRIAQVMQNILSNAVKFTNAGGSVWANVRQIKDGEDNLTLQFEAKDTGIGMSEEFLTEVCKPFNQSDKGFARTHGGLGLGLYLTKYYLEAMNGKMSVVSKLGEGSTFTVTIPLKKANGEQILSQNMDFSHLKAIIGGTKEEENQKLKDLLKRLKIKCDTYTSSEKIVKRIHSRIGTGYEYAVCVLDESVIEADPSMLEKIAVEEKAPHIFCMTGKSEKVDGFKENEFIDQVLYKPIFQSVLFDAVVNTFGSYEVINHKTQTADFHGMKAMIVEDNSVNADILLRVLQKANIEAILCENGKKAIETFEENAEDTFKIIFMDIQMPVMDGYEATRKIRGSEKAQGKTIPIIAVSANAFPEDIENSISAGMNEHLSKPIDAAILYQTIKRYCNGKEIPIDKG